MIKNVLKHTSTSYCSIGFKHNKNICWVEPEFQKMVRGVNSMTGKPSVVITALVFMYENDGTVES